MKFVARWIVLVIFGNLAESTRSAKSFDIVLDPFAGGGATIDVCKKRLRRYCVSDRKPGYQSEHCQPSRRAKGKPGSYPEYQKAPLLRRHLYYTQKPA